MKSFLPFCITILIVFTDSADPFIQNTSLPILAASNQTSGLNVTNSTNIANQSIISLPPPSPPTPSLPPPPPPRISQLKTLVPPTLINPPQPLVYPTPTLNTNNYNEQEASDSLQKLIDQDSSSVEICNSSACSYHWVFALDKSGSMLGAKWSQVKLLMNGLGQLLTKTQKQFMTVFTFDSGVSKPYQYLEYDDPSKWNSNQLPAQASGGTNFAAPLSRAVESIKSHEDINSCFVFLTDGQASYPSAQVEEMLQLKDQIIAVGNKFCVLCYFIGNSYDRIPEAYQRVCSELQAITENSLASQDVPQPSYYAPPQGGLSVNSLSPSTATQKGQTSSLFASSLGPVPAPAPAPSAAVLKVKEDTLALQVYSNFAQTLKKSYADPVKPPIVDPAANSTSANISVGTPQSSTNVRSAVQDAAQSNITTNSTSTNSSDAAQQNTTTIQTNNLQKNLP